MRMWKLIHLGILAEGGHDPRAGICMTGRGNLHFKADLLLFFLLLCFQVTIACRVRWFEEEGSTSTTKTKENESPLGKSSNVGRHA